LLGRYKEYIEPRLRALARAVSAVGVGPNMITLMGLAFGLAGLYAVYTTGFPGYFVAASAAMALMDMLDGLVARYTGKSSRFGAFLDSTVDRAEDAVLVAGLLYAGLIGPGAALLLLTGMFLISYARARAEALGVPMAGVGIAERPERILLVLLALLVSLFSIDAARAIVYVLTALVYVTVAERVIHVYRVLG